MQQVWHLVIVSHMDENLLDLFYSFEYAPCVQFMGLADCRTDLEPSVGLDPISSSWT